MRKKHFSRLWKKLTRGIPTTIMYEQPPVWGTKGESTRESLRKSEHQNKIKGDKNRKPLARQTKTMRTQGRV